MADVQGKLSPEEIQQIIKWVDGHRKNRACPVCQSDEWMVGPSISAPVPLSPGEAGMAINVGAAKVTPVVQTICKVCGHIQFFNAVFVGLQMKKAKTDG